jgi:hypothetical protein
LGGGGVVKIEFLSAVDDGRGHFIVQRRITDDQGGVAEGVHIFPYDTLEWRAAEYGIDPSDVDTLLDVVLAEPYLSPEDWSTGPSLYGEDDHDMAEVRQAHLSRCARVKLANRISTRGTSADPLTLIRETHQMDADAVEIKRQLVARGREQARHTAKVKRTGSGRVARLQAELERGR